MKFIKTTLCLALCLAVKFSHAQNDLQVRLDSFYSIYQDESQSDSMRAQSLRNFIWQGYLFSAPDTAFILAEKLLEYGKNHNYPEATAKGYNTQAISWYVRTDYEKATEYYNRSIEVNEKIGNLRGAVGARNNMAVMYMDQGKYAKALDMFNQCLKIAEKLGNKKMLAGYQGNIGILYGKVGNPTKALDYYIKSLTIQEEMEDADGIASGLNNIGGIYKVLGDYAKALEYFERSLVFRKQTEDRRALAILLSNIGSIYINLKDYDKALDYSEQGLKLREDIGDQKGIATSLNNIGSLFLEQQIYDKGLDYMLRSLKLREELGDQQGMSASYYNIGGVYLELKKYTKGLEYCIKSIDLARSIGALTEERNACGCLYEGYKLTGNDAKALEYYVLQNQIDDSISILETSAKLQQMEFQKQVLSDSMAQVEKDHQIKAEHDAEVAKNKKTRNILIGSGLFALLLAGGFYSRWRYTRNVNKVISEEKDRSENLLLNILPAEIAEELKEKGKAEARDFKEVSILFTDFKDFTQTSKKMDAKSLVSEINTCFEAFDKICEQYNIEKIKTIGDSYMAAGGLPIPSEDSVKNTVLAGIAMADFIKKRKIKREVQGEIPFQMRVGIHTGPVVAGIVGVKKFQYDIWGDTVNTASRMESNGEIGKVNVSQHTYELLKDDEELKFEERGKIEAKGLGEVQMFFVSKTYLL